MTTTHESTLTGGPPSPLDENDAGQIPQHSLPPGPLLTLRDWEDAARHRFADLHQTALWDFLAGGAGEEDTLRRTPALFRQFRLLPRVLGGIERHNIDTSVRVLDRHWPVPLGIAPTALHRICDMRREIATVQAARTHGVPMVVSTFSSTRIEDIADSTNPAEHPLYQQLYLLRDRQVTLDMAHRAAAAGAAGLVVTVDSPWLGVRLRDRRNHFAIPGSLRALNLEASLGRAADITSPEAYSNTTMDPEATWQDITDLVNAVNLPVIVKGILAPEDLHAAIAAGATGVIVSNHGGRQLDRAITPLEALPSIAGMAPPGYPVLLDGGIRSGEDIVVALALGAHAVLIGRPVLHGLIVDGHNGVRRILELLIDQLTNTIGLMGRRSVLELDETSIVAASMTNDYPTHFSRTGSLPVGEHQEAARNDLGNPRDTPVIESMIRARSVP